MTAHPDGEGRQVDPEVAAQCHPAVPEVPPEVFKHIEQVSGVGTWVWDPQSNTVAWSDQVHRIFGTNPDDEAPTFDSYVAMLHPDDRDRVVANARHAVLAGSSYTMEHRIVQPGGSIRELHSKGRAEVDADGRVTYLAGSVQDVTASLSATRKLAGARDLFAGVLDAATEQAIIGTDRDGLITVFNRGAVLMLGHAAQDVIGVLTPLAFYDPAQVAQVAAADGRMPSLRVVLGEAELGRPDTTQWTYLTKDGRHLQVLVTTTAMRSSTGEITGFIQVGTDLTARLRAERALEASEALFQDIFDTAPSGILLATVVGADQGRMLRVNPAMSRITGYTEQQLLAMTVADLTHPDSLRQYAEAMDSWTVPGGRGPIEAERRWVHADGHDIWVRLNGCSTRPADPAIVVAMVEDITARKLAEDRLHHLALHDALTGLPNRLLLLDRLEHALQAGVRSGRQVALLYVDLDGFKAVNDRAGHLVGDDVLSLVARRLLQSVRPGDTVARMGGDEFVVICPDLSRPEDTQVVADRLLRQLAVPYRHLESEYRLSASIGIAWSLPGVSARTLLREADAAMYQAKQNGRNRIQRCGDQDRHRSGI